MTNHAVQVETDGHVRVLTLCRPEAYNTITPQLRDELSAALDDAAADRDARVVLLQAEGQAFCAGYELAGATADQARNTTAAAPAWDTAADLHMIGAYADVWAKLHHVPKPTIAAVAGWCIAGGTNIVFNADIIVAAESARFGYPPSRVWGIPEAPWTWVARLGVERARRYMLTGDEFTGVEAAAMGAVLECVPDDELHDRAHALAQRIALVPGNQLEMVSRAINEVAREMYDPVGSRLVGCTFDGVARHTQEGHAWVARAQEVGFRQAVRERDDPFGDYGQRSPS